jgi:phage shock protein A
MTIFILVITALVALGGYYMITNKKFNNRIKARVRGVGDDLADNIGDIVDDRSEAIHSRKQTNADLERKLARVLVEIKESKDNASNAIEKATEAGELVVEALSANNEDAANEFLVQQEEQESLAETYTAAVEALEKTFNELKAKLDESKTAVKTAERSTAVFEARHEALQLRKQMSAAASAFNDLGGLDFSGQDDTLRRQERELEAMDELSVTSGESTINDFKKSRADKARAAKLAAIKAKMNQ